MTNLDQVHRILMIEDNSAHVRLIQEGFKQITRPYQIRSVDNGVDAIAYLRSEPPFTERLLPDLVLLDLNLPRKNGREVLAEIKTDPKLKHIPILILSTSQRPEDIQESYQLHANCYLHKPSNLKQLFHLVEQIETFWFRTVSLPLT
ncbi:response regulator [Roseofilum reptotaenium CS-1145]|uniref:Response regulator n=1 Tax=Roseofilum reptotaenium AO1-A TaxID=1925591 RepID=A0A1L9QL36_9CYAN|nr:MULTISPECIES: response regulator [Roseofilum]OJJ18127.1 response regulator [Roseofilum reptotaenium AO1-A]MBP0013573.1 response regulator [Roseofilum sp. SID3]MBP0023099.1 response regulator [Roseofilum sp. SID2]MBP0038355.1 response regulator [Roseofilum sp. SID1]MDB9517791.1 response regulator [Roseofilum reptotaenium CS-1145]